MDRILFYRTQDLHGYMSNFSAHRVFLKGKTWRTTEHYFQAQKFADTEFEEQLRLIESPMKVAQAGRDRKKPLRKDWEEVKEQIMLEALRAKFTQHRDLREQLLATGNAELIEHTANDSYWADGGDGHGLNRLGILLMQVREELKE
ncbi:NADAR family protein [Deinococcus roseus]|uniref:Swarming motility protein n=1 Tax=Deinococcus roseus TaxID=392414 RepID=A0ABQ2CVY1_9DEIO|nr:NADAR family protein [Deinococcus roseus]GGJ26054.1 swarming motility protein [Deinococcus roseus]